MLYSIMILITFVALTYYEDKLLFNNETINDLCTRNEMPVLKAFMAFLWPITLGYYAFIFLEPKLPRSK